ncbi:hypothetical protein BD289DRAFT_366349 [Coniella lustricola]|uniref:Uncharacterized protein n=1 Tax=Coniella lustricola TaxID=2025994 RepID=A0A2T3AB17_9PEZI|nr:hypothetical protein BD289DRAFT_366349 [Coniella lustricola]
MVSSSLLSLAFIISPVFAVGPAVPPQPEDRIPPKVDPTRLENFPWTNPFSSASKLGQFDATCDSTRTFSAAEFQLHDLRQPEPTGLKPYSEALKGLFYGRGYPGGWEGMDNHGYERNMLKMEYDEVPAKVKDWIQEQESAKGPGQGLYAVLDKPLSRADDKDDEDESGQKVVIFAPGAIYENLPLWVAENSNCEESLSDLSTYTATPSEGAVVGWTTEHIAPSRTQGRRDIKFTVKAQVLGPKAKEETDDESTETAKSTDESQRSNQAAEKVQESQVPRQEANEPVKDNVKDEL